MNNEEFEIANEILTELRGISNAINHASKFEVSFATCEAHKDFIEAKPSCVHCLRAENKRLAKQLAEYKVGEVTTAELEDLNKRTEKLEAEHVSLKAENERLNYEFREMGMQCGRLETENERLQKENEFLSAEVTRLTVIAYGTTPINYTVYTTGSNSTTEEIK